MQCQRLALCSAWWALLGWVDEGTQQATVLTAAAAPCLPAVQQSVLAVTHTCCGCSPSPPCAASPHLLSGTSAGRSGRPCAPRRTFQWSTPQGRRGPPGPAATAGPKARQPVSTPVSTPAGPCPAGVSRMHAAFLCCYNAPSGEPRTWPFLELNGAHPAADAAAAPPFASTAGSPLSTLRCRTGPPKIRGRASFGGRPSTRSPNLRLYADRNQQRDLTPGGHLFTMLGGFRDAWYPV